MNNDISNITVVEHPISEFEQIELDSNGQPIKHTPTVEEYKAKQPDYNAGEVGTVRHPEDYVWNAELNRLEDAYTGKPVGPGTALTREGRLAIDGEVTS